MNDEIESSTEKLLRDADARAESFADGDAPAAPRLRIAIVTCMDARIDPVALFGLKPGDAHVIRNAGGLVTDDVLRSLTLSQALLETREILVVQHTRCGVNADEEELRKSVADATGVEPPHLGGFSDLEASVRQGIERLRAARHLPAGDTARGFIYDVETGNLREVTGDRER